MYLFTKKRQIYMKFKFLYFTNDKKNNLFYDSERNIWFFYVHFHKAVHYFVLWKIYFYVISRILFSFSLSLSNKQTISSLHFFFVRAKMSAKGCRLSYSAGGHASPIRSLEVLPKSVVVHWPPWMFRLKTDKNNLESSFRKFERYFGGRNVGFTALMLIIFHSLRFPVSLRITIRPDFFPCNLYTYVTSRCITYSRILLF